MENKDKVKDLSWKIIKLFDNIDYATAAHAMVLAISSIVYNYSVEENSMEGNREDIEKFFDAIIEDLKTAKTTIIKSLTDNGY